MKNRNRLFKYAIAVIFVCSLFAKAQEEKSDEKPVNEVQINYSTESLTRNLGTWRTASIYLQRKLKNRQTIWANYRIGERNGIRDQEFLVGTYKQLSNKWAVSGEAMFSPTSKFVGKYSLNGEVEKGFRKGIVAHFGVRHTKFSTVKATTAYGIGEKYWGSNRVSYTLYVTKLTNAGTSPTHRFSYNRYFGEKSNTIGIAASVGREHESLGPTLGVLKSKTWSVSFSEKHWLTDKIGINVDATIHRQGTSYYRRGLNFGVRYRF